MGTTPRCSKRLTWWTVLTVASLSDLGHRFSPAPLARRTASGSTVFREPDYRVTILPAVIVDIGPSALKHGYTEHEIRFALEHAHIEREVVDDDPPRTWIFGFAPDATLLEIILVHMSGKDLVIHCMKARRRELDKALRVRGGK